MGRGNVINENMGKKINLIRGLQVFIEYSIQDEIGSMRVILVKG